MSEKNNSNLKEYKLLISHVGDDSALALKIVEAIKEKSEEAEVSDNFVITPIFMESKINGCVGDFMEWSEKQVIACDGVLAIITDNTVKERIADNGIELNDKVVYQEIRLAQKKARDIIIFINENTTIPDGQGYNISIVNMKQVSFDSNSENVDEKIDEALNDVVIHARHRFAGKPLLEYAGDVYTDIDTTRTKIGDTSNYLGRKSEIEEIERHFADNKNIVCITGFGGIGKTTLAKMYAKAHNETEVSILHCSAEEKDIRNPVINIPMEHEIPDFDKMPIEEKFFARLKQLEKINKKTLIIIDNFDADFSTYENQDAITALSNLKNKNCKFLISSRQKTERVEVGLVDVGKLSDDELFELFYRDSKCKKTRENDEAIQKLIKITNGHTMTIELSARAVGDDENDVTPQEMVENLTSATTDITTNLNDRHNEFRNYATVFEHLKVLFALTKVTDTQKHLLGALSFVCRRGLTIKELKANFEYNKEDLKRLCSLGYISKTKDDVVSYFLHPLMSELCFAEFVESDEPFDELIEYIVYEKSHSTPNDTIIDLEIRFDYAEHIRSRLSNVKEIKSLSTFWAICWIDLYLGDIAKAKGNLDTAEACYKQPYEIFKEIADKSGRIDARKGLSLTLMNLGKIAEKKDDLDTAKEYYKQSYKICKEIAEECGTIDARKGLSLSLMNLGNIARANGNFILAEEFYEQCLEIEKDIADKGGTINARRNLSISLNNLGYITNVKGNIYSAEEYCKQAYEIAKDIVDESGTIDSRRNLSISLGNFGDISKAKGDIDTAEEYYKQSYKIIKEVAKESGTIEDFYNVIYSCGRMADISKDKDDELSFWLEACEIAKKLYESNVDYNNDYESILTILGSLYISARDIENAMNIYRILESVKSDKK